MVTDCRVDWNFNAWKEEVKQSLNKSWKVYCPLVKKINRFVFISICFFSFCVVTRDGFHCAECCHSFVVSFHSTVQSNWLRPPLVSTPRYYECPPCGCQSGDAGKGERGEDQPGGAIRSSPLPGGPVPERECQLFPHRSAADEIHYF